MIATLLLAPLTVRAEQALPPNDARWYQWRPMTGCTVGTPDALKRSLTAKRIRFEATEEGDVSWTDPTDGQDEVAVFFHGVDACVAFMRNDDAAWFAYGGDQFGCVAVTPTQQQVIDFHRKQNGPIIARSYDGGNVIIITSTRPASKLHIISIRGKKFCESLGPVYENAPADNLAVMKSRKL